MALPEQLQKQIDAVNEGVKQRMAKLEGAPSDEAGTDEDPANTPAEPQGEPVQSRANEAASPSNVAREDADENNPTYAQRWRSLQGVYNAQQRKLDEVAAQKENLEALVAQMQAGPRTQQAPTQAKSHVTDKDVSEYGEDMVEFARRAARDEMTPIANAMRQLMGRLDQLQGVVPVVQQVASTQAQSASDRFYEKLTVAVPDWSRINDLPKFHDWLLSVEPFSGIQRQVLLEDAHKSMDIARVANMFETWMREAGVAAPQADAAGAAAAPMNTRQTAAQRLEQQVAPGRANAGSAPPAQKQPKMWTRDGIAEFYRNKRDGKFKGRDAEAAALEGDIFTAQREGRVQLSAA
jgi:hypothetical protein